DCEWILRLEDDVLVNRYILHNLCTWPATQHPKFAFGTLFMPDYWHRTPRIFRKEPDESCMYRDTKEVEGAQGQFVRVSTFERYLNGVPKARRDRGLAKPTNHSSFDLALSRAAWAYEKRVFVHSPALVDLHQESLQSKIDLPKHLGASPADPHSHYWGHRAFDPEWRRGAYEYEQHDSLAPCVLTA